MIPSYVTHIGKGAFFGCRNLTNITIAEGVTSIGDRAFSYCSNLKGITIADSVTSIGDYAFSSCSSLISISIPDGMTSISEASFYDCTSLASITIPDSVTNISNFAFDRCSSLISITIPEGVTSIGGSAFRGCISLPSITIPDNVTSIGNSTFFGCNSLKTITIPDGLKSIGRDAFYGCRSLTSITIPESVTSIGDWAFAYCSSLTSVTIPASVTSIGNDAFPCLHETLQVECNSFAHTWAKGNGYGNLVADPDLAYGYTGINHQSIEADAEIEPTCTEAGLTEGSHCLTCGDVVQKQTIVPSLGHDWGEAEYNWNDDNASVTATRICAHDAEHTESETVKAALSVLRSPTEEEQGLYAYVSEEFWNEAFTAQTSPTIAIPALGTLNVLRLPAALSAVDEEAFMNLPCQAVLIPNGCESIGSHAFAGCTSLIYVHIPASVTNIAEDAFAGCEGVVLDYQ